MTKILSKRGDKTKYFFSLIRQIPHYLDNVKYPTAHFKHENKGFFAGSCKESFVNSMWLLSFFVYLRVVTKCDLPFFVLHSPTLPLMIVN